jgi:hypothetical protein
MAMASDLASAVVYQLAAGGLATLNVIIDYPILLLFLVVLAATVDL